MNFVFGIIFGFAEMHARISLAQFVFTTYGNPAIYIPLAFVSLALFVVGYKLLSWQKLLLVVLSMAIGVCAHVYMFQHILGTFEQQIRTTNVMITSVFPYAFPFAAGIFGIAIGELKNKKSSDGRK